MRISFEAQKKLEVSGKKKSFTCWIENLALGSVEDAMLTSWSYEEDGNYKGWQILAQ